MSKGQTGVSHTLAMDPGQSLSLTDQSGKGISIGGLDVLIRTGTELLRNLVVVKHDLELMKDRVRIRYGLDFSEIYSFLWPNKRGSYSPQTTAALLGTPHIDLFLPPGSAFEFLHALERQKSNFDQIRHEVEQVSQRQLVTALLSLLETRDNEEDGSKQTLARGLSDFLNRSFDISNYKGVADKLNLISKAVHLESEVEWTSGFLDVVPDRDTLQNCLAALNNYRPAGYDRANLIDAYNYAFVTALSNNRFNKSRDVYLLVTSSPIPYRVFGEFIWDRFPLTSSKPLGQAHSLVRHPIQILYTRAVLEHSKSGLDELKHLIRSLDWLLAHWRGTSQYKNFIREKIPSYSLVVPPKSKKYLERYVRFVHGYNSMFNKVRSIIESDITGKENLRLFKDVSGFSVGTTVYGTTADPVEIGGSILPFKMLDELTAATLRTIQSLRNKIKSMPQQMVADLDTEGLIHRGRQLEVVSRSNDEFNCLEFAAVVKDKSKTQILAGDIFKEFYSTWWNSTCSFSDFIGEVKRFATNATRESAALEVRKMVRKHYEGILLYVDGLPEPIHSEIGDFSLLSYDDILEKVRNHSSSAPVMIRIALPYADVCYDFMPYRGLPQRIGVTSHLPLKESLSWLLKQTCVENAPIAELRKAVAFILDEYERRQQ